MDREMSHSLWENFEERVDRLEKMNAFRMRANFSSLSFAEEEEEDVGVCVCLKFRIIGSQRRTRGHKVKNRPLSERWFENG